MTFLSAVSSDGQRFKIFPNGTWEVDCCVLPDKAGFRSSSWGAAIEEVKAQEKTDLVVDNDDLLAYKTAVGGLPSLAVFDFVDGHLVMGRYVIDVEHANQNSFLTDFNSLKDLLKKKYGPTSTSNAYWQNELFHDDYSQWGLAISIGHVSFFETWDEAETQIELQLHGDNHQVKLCVMYRSKALKPLMDAKHEQSALEGL